MQWRELEVGLGLVCRRHVGGGRRVLPSDDLILVQRCDS
jgi:hypothetical protein